MSRRGGGEQLGFDWRGQGVVAGVDEAGRGPLAGPVVAAAVILDPHSRIEGLADSKVLSPARRATMSIEIRSRCAAWALGWADATEIDALNILQATMLAMRRALLGLHCAPAHVVVDGDRCPDLRGCALDCTIESVVKGDARVACVSAASIVAKVARDDFMVELDRLHPGYGLAEHKGYPTPRHLEALARLGPSPVHRRSFAPVQSCHRR
jgi:ribonuclease HII